MVAELKCDISEQQGTAVVALEGEIDVYTAPRLQDQLLDLSKVGRNRVVVDLEGVSFLDSNGLGVIVTGLKQFRSAGGDMALVCTRPQVRKVFEITSLTDFVGVYDELQTAVNAVQQGN